MPNIQVVGEGQDYVMKPSRRPNQAICVTWHSGDVVVGVKFLSSVDLDLLEFPLGR